MNVEIRNPLPGDPPRSIDETLWALPAIGIGISPCFPTKPTAGGGGGGPGPNDWVDESANPWVDESANQWTSV